MELLLVCCSESGAWLYYLNIRTYRTQCFTTPFILTVICSLLEGRFCLFVWIFHLSLAGNSCFGISFIPCGKFVLVFHLSLAGNFSFIPCFGISFIPYGKFVLVFHLSLAGNSGRLTWVRLQQPQEQRHPFLTVRAVFSCV